MAALYLKDSRACYSRCADCNWRKRKQASCGPADGPHWRPQRDTTRQKVTQEELFKNLQLGRLGTTHPPRPAVTPPSRSRAGPRERPHFVIDVCPSPSTWPPTSAANAGGRPRSSQTGGGGADVGKPQPVRGIALAGCNNPQARTPHASMTQ